ncbi:MAG: helix-turn-helix transcriptional regulator [Promethearchaeota archaeon]
MSDKQTINQTCQLLSAKMLGDMLSLSKRQIFRLNSCGKIPAPVRINGAVRWKLSDIELFLQWNCPDRQEFEARKNAE